MVAAISGKVPAQRVRVSPDCAASIAACRSAPDGRQEVPEPRPPPVGAAQRPAASVTRPWQQFARLPVLGVWPIVAHEPLLVAVARVLAGALPLPVVLAAARALTIAGAPAVPGPGLALVVQERGEGSRQRQGSPQAQQSPPGACGRKGRHQAVETLRIHTLNLQRHAGTTMEAGSQQRAERDAARPGRGQLLHPCVEPFSVHGPLPPGVRTVPGGAPGGLSVGVQP